MTLNVGVARGAISTSFNGTADITDANMGATPKAAICFATRAEVDDTLTNNALMSVGFTDGTNNNCVAFESDDNSTITADTFRSIRTDACFIDPPVAGEDEVFGDGSFIADGVRLTTLSNVTTAPILANTWMLGGDDVVDARTGSFVLNGTTPVDVTDVGFEFDLLFLIGMGSAANANGCNLSFGMIHNGGAVTQKSFGLHLRGTNPQQNGSQITTDAGYTEINFNMSLRHTASIGSIDSSGFTYTPTGDAAADRVIYLAVQFSASVAVDLFDFDSPTATGADSQTSASTTPDIGLILGTNLTARDTLTTSSLLGFGFTGFTANDVYSNTASDEDAASPRVTRSRSTSGALQVLDTDGTIDSAATLTSLNSNGWTWNYTTAPPSARMNIGLSIGIVGGGGGDITINNIQVDPETGWNWLAYDGSVIPSGSILYFADSLHTGGNNSATATTTITTTANQYDSFKIINVTDGSEGIITSHTTGANAVFTIGGGLSGGVDNDFDTNDVLEIVVNLDTGDQLVWEQSTDNNGSVSLTSTGVPIITGPSGTHNFDYKIRDTTDSQVSSVFTVTATV